MIAVTGANGLLGSFIVRKLIENNETFVAIRRKDSDTSLLNDVAKHITWREADVLDPLEITDALKDVTHVIHTAAIVSFNPHRATAVMDINVLGTRHIVDACLALGIKRLVHVSSVAALGRQKGQTLIDEKNMWVDSPLNSVYAQSKYQAELEVFRGQEEGLSTAIINPSIILAPSDWTRSSAKLFKYCWDERPFYIDGSLNYVDVRDVTNIIYTLLHSNVQGRRFIANAGKISYKSFFQSIAKKFRKKSPSIKLNKTLARAVARVETFRAWLGKNEPLITRETARLAGSEFLYDNQNVRKTFSFEFQPFDETLDWCCQHYLAKMETKN